MPLTYSAENPFRLYRDAAEPEATAALGEGLRRLYEALCLEIYFRDDRAFFNTAAGRYVLFDRIEEFWPQYMNVPVYQWRHLGAGDTASRDAMVGWIDAALQRDHGIALYRDTTAC
jgi:hypothetical protein